MSGRIPENKIDEIRTAADIAEVISGYLTLKKRGRNYLGLCPFHNEKTPSFSVSPEKQIYHCFGCGKGGNVYSFLMEHEKLTFIEAVKMLADRYGIMLPKYEKESDGKTERLFYANRVAAEYFQKNLTNRKYKDKIQKYIHDTRGLSTETADKFQLGLASEEWQGLVNYANTKDVKPEELAEAGLAGKSAKDGKYYDRFRLRLMIPIYNITGKIIAFGGRTLQKGERAKYVNSPDTPLYNKSFILYGLNFAKQAIRESGTVILVEGYFDLMSLSQAGIENVAAVSGTAFTTQQARLLSRFAQKVYVFFDPDSAGRSAALRSIENFYNYGIEPMIISSPAKQDPDSFVRENGPEAVNELIENAQDFISFRFVGVDISQLSNREKEDMAREIKSLGAKIDDTLRRDVFISSAAEKLGLSVSILRTDSTGTQKNSALPERTRNINIIESELLSLFVNHSPLIELVRNDLMPDDFTGPGHGQIYTKMIEAHERDGEINPQKMMESIKDENLRSGLSFISTFDWGDIDLTSVVKEYRQMLLKRKRESQIEALKEQLGRAEKAGDIDLAKKLTLEIKYLLEKRN